MFNGIKYWTAESQCNIFQTVQLIHISISIWDEKNQYKNKQWTLTHNTRWTCVPVIQLVWKRHAGLYYHILILISKSISSNLWQNIPSTNNTIYHHSNRGVSLVEYTHHISQHSSPYTVKIKERVCVVKCSTGTSQKIWIWWQSSFFLVTYFKKLNFHIF